MYKVVFFKEPIAVNVHEGRSVKRNVVEVDTENYVPSITSLNRTKNSIRDIVKCNDFKYFCTFTFDPKKVDSFQLNRCWLKMSTWLHHQADRSRERKMNFKYLIIPEQHKSGRWHFHALISGYVGTLRDTGLKSPALYPIYNMTSFRSGFTTAVEIDSSEHLASYVTKYITKDFVKTFNQRRFFCSRNLVRPVKTINSSVFRDTLPIFRVKTAETDSTEQYTIFKPPYKGGLGGKTIDNYTTFCNN